MAYGYFIDLVRRTASNKPFNIANNPKYDGYQRNFTSIVYKVFDRKTSGGAIKSMLN